MKSDTISREPSVRYRFHAPVFPLDGAAIGEAQHEGEREKQSRRRVSNLFPWGPNPECRETETDEEGGQRQRDRKRGREFMCLERVKGTRVATSAA